MRTSMYQPQLDDDEIFDHYEGNPQSHNAVGNFLNGEPDNLFGLFENKAKKAAKKEKKAEKKLAKGHVKAAERKLGKANKILTKIAGGQQDAIATKTSIANVNNTQAVLNQMDTSATESGNTSPGQIGSAAQSTTPLAATGGGGGGDMDSGYFPDAAKDTTDPTDGTVVGDATGTDTTTLPGVTVFGFKPNTLLIAAVAIGVIIAIYYFTRKKK